MSLETEFNIALTAFFRPILAQCIQEATEKINASSVSVTPPAPDEVLTIEQAAELLNLTKQTVYGMVSARKIPYCKPTGAQLYFLRSDLIDWLRKHRTCTTEEAAEAYQQPKRRTRPARRTSKAGTVA